MKRAQQFQDYTTHAARAIGRATAFACPPIETLETRVFLSGSVLASVVEGNLRIRGDSAANIIVLDQTGLNADQVRISGGVETTINGQADSLVLSGITHGLRVRLGLGADNVTMNGLALPGKVCVESGSPAATVALNNVTVAKGLHVLNSSNVSLQAVEVQRGTEITGRRASDVVTIDDSTFHGAVRIHTDRSADVIQIDSNGDPLAPTTQFAGPVCILMGAGNDLLQLGVPGQAGNHSVFSGKTWLGGGPGTDTVRNVDSSTNLGAPRFKVKNFELNTTTADTTAPTVSSTDPADNATDIALDKNIAATFSEAMDPLTITAANVTVTAPGQVAVSGTVSYVGTTLTFTPTDPLAADTTFTATITTGVTDVAGNALANNFVWSFTTGITLDATAPTVSSTDPGNTATGVALNKKIAATFSEAMDPLTITTANVTVTAPGQVTVSGTVAYVGTTMTFTPTDPLAADTTFTTTITTGVTDVAGNPLANNFVWSFTTGATLDTTAPTVSSTDPGNTATGVALNKKIAATFSEAMDPLTITTANVTVTTPGPVSVLGTVAYVGTTMTFTPTIPLAPNTTVTVTVSTGAQDLAGNPLANDFVWSFTTGSTADTTAPTVSSTNPAAAATGVSVNQKIAATFSEAMDPLTITAAHFTVTGPGGTPVTGTVNYDAASKIATFTPSSTLAPSTTFTATITTGVKDLAGNPLASRFAWTFTTGATPDTTAPVVTLTSPANLQTNVAINKTIAATFSESIDPLTIAANFKVKGPGNTPVNGTVNYDSASKIATFVGSSNFSPNTTYTATITGGINGVKDLAGNPLASDKVWTFTTGTQIAQAPINLGSAGAFAVMATASISGTGPTQINGDVGLNPGSAEGIPPAQVNGTIHVDDQAIRTAQSDLLHAYNDAVSRSVTSANLPGNMGGLTFTPGLYTNSTSVLIQGAGPANNVTLDAQGDPNAIFIFQMGSTLTTGPGAQVILAGGAKAGNIFWQVGTSATLNTTTIFKGNILAAVTITVNGGSVVEGRLLGGSNSDGSVTVNASTVTVPAP